MLTVHAPGPVVLDEKTGRITVIVDERISPLNGNTAEMIFLLDLTAPVGTRATAEEAGEAEQEDREDQAGEAGSKAV